MSPPRTVFTGGWRTIVLLAASAVAILYLAHRLEERDDGDAGGPRSLESPNAPSRGTGKDTTGDGAALADPGVAESPRRRSPAGLLSGRVTDASGRPIEGALVTLGAETARTDSRGEFALAASGSDLVVRHADHFGRTLTAEQRRAMAPRNGGRITVVLFRGARITGGVTSVDGRPLEGVEVSVGPEGRSAPTPGATTRTDGDGRYASALLAPGSHRVRFAHPGFRSLEGMVTVTAAREDVGLDVVLLEGEHLVLHAFHRSDTNALEPVPDAAVWLIGRDPESGVEESRFLGHTDERGVLEARRGASAPRRVRITVPGFREVEEPVHGAEVRVELVAAPLVEGRAIDARTGKPVDPIEVELQFAMSTDPEAATSFRRAPDRGVTFGRPPAGAFRVGLPPVAGTYRVVVRAGERLSGVSGEFAFDGATSPPPLSIELRPDPEDADPGVRAVPAGFRADGVDAGTSGDLPDGDVDGS